jgi:DNA (cytosine-5)-methyltransferase 1
VRYGSVCSGIEAASVAWEPLGWTPAWFCEIDPFPSAVLAHHYPQVTNHGDFTKLIDSAHPVHADGSIDLLVGGTPCQAFSVAGLRQGLADARGGLTLEFLRLVRTCAPRWVVWENVPGVLSQDGGRAFGAFLGGLEDLGYGWAYRVLDAQYVRVDGYPGAVPQRRQRVFVVAHSGGDFARAAAVLLEPEGVHRNSPTSREARQGTTGGIDLGFEVCGTLSDGAHHGGGLNGQDAYTGRILPVAGSHWDHPMNPHPAITQAHNAGGIGASNQEIFSQRGSGLVGTRVRLYTADGVVADPIGANEANTYTNEGSGNFRLHNCVGEPPSMSVRRLTPVECERLQGFPDDYTRIPWRGKPAEECPDGGRYKALGNSMACNVMRWIGRRIELVDAV